MLSGNVTKAEFATLLDEVAAPSRPIKSIEHLLGRDDQLEVIERALGATGRHVFVYGDRGVGKSSLGATSAYQYQHAGAEPILVSGSFDATFKSIIANIACQALGRSKLELKKSSESSGFEWRGIKFGVGIETSPLDVASQIASVGDATELLKQASARHSPKSIVVLDEFDTIADVIERNKFASLLKKLGDQSISLKFVFTGVGTSLDELLGAHPSAYRQLETVELPRLSWEGRRGIVEQVANKFGCSVDTDVLWRIATVSDGYPYYVHSIAEKMMWEAFDDESVISELGWDHYHAGLRAAIQGINAELRKPYDRAVCHRATEFEDVVWATADGEDLHRSSDDMYESYRIITRKRLDRVCLESKKFKEALRSLKSQSFGTILSPLANRRGWYTYTEKMLRGYVRMQAEANGVELSGERMAPRVRMHIPGNVRTGTYGPLIPKGVRQNRPLAQPVGTNNLPFAKARSGR